MFATAGPWSRKKIAHRVGDGIEVTVFSTVDDLLVVNVVDQRSKGTFELVVPLDRVGFAYFHPHAFAVEQGLDCDLSALKPA